MAPVDTGPFRVASLISRQGVDELDLQVGSVPVAAIKSTMVVVERDRHMFCLSRGRRST